MRIIGVGVGWGHLGMLNIINCEVSDAAFPLDRLDDVAEKRHVSSRVRLQFYISQLLQVA